MCNKLTIYILLLMFAVPYIVAGQSKSISFKLKDIERKDEKKQGNNYEKITLGEAFRSNDVGKPDLPVFYYKFYVPKGEKVKGLTFDSSEKTEILLHADLLPSQHKVKVSEIANDTLFDTPDSLVYRKDALFPEKQTSILRSDFIDGDLEIVTIAVYPMQYNPVQKKISLTTNGKINLITSSTKTDKTTMFKNHSNSIESVGMLESIVENPEDIEVGLTKTISKKGKSNNLKSTTITWSVPFYEYVIITSRELKPAFNQFVEWKKRKGYNAGIVCIEDILLDAAATGDPLSPTLTDDAGKLRQYLKAGYLNPSPKTKYALLGGDYTVVPIRYGQAGSIQDWNDGISKIPSDLYFSDFNTNWTAVNTIRTGIYYSGFDYGSEIYVGRILCKSEADIKIWTTKVLKYEQNPGNGNYSYLAKALMTKADNLDTINFSILPSIFSTKKRMVELPTESSSSPNYPKGVDVISELNTNYGLYCMFNHGKPNAFGTALSGINSGEMPRYSVTSSDSFLDAANISAEDGNGLDNLTNSNFPTIIYSVSCTTMPFDDYYYWGVGQKIPTGSRTIGTAYTVANTGGGPAYLGNTRDGWNPTGSELEKIFFDSISIFSQLGIAEAKSKIGFSDHWTCLTHNLLGCPETELWTATPTTFGSASSTKSGTTVSVNTGGIADSKICVMSALDNGSSYFNVQPGVSSYSFSNVPSPYYVTITKHNMIPKIINPTTVLIEHRTLNTDCYLNCETVSAGYNVDTSDSDYGNVVIASGTSVTFDATGDITLAPGFEVQLGAVFEAK